MKESTGILQVSSNVTLTDEILCYTEPDTGRHNTIVRCKEFPYLLRPRSEVLIFRDNYLFLAFERPGIYKLPGGNWDVGETPEEAAIRECQEEARMNIDNLFLCGKYVTLGNVHPWVKENVPEELQWQGYYTQIYTANYVSDYTGEISDIHTDSTILNNGKFYLMDQNISMLSMVHLNCLKSSRNNVLLTNYISRYSHSV